MVCKFFITIILISLSIYAKTQTTPELGFSFGTSQYVGDLNTSKLFYKPTFAVSGEFIYNLNLRTALKTGISYYTIKGDGNLNYLDLNERSINFNNKYINYHIMYMINFLDYDFSTGKNNFTPYVILGIGFSRIMSSNTDAVSNLAIPFGPGLRVLYKNKISIGLEYLINRSFNDKIDDNMAQNYGHTIDNDRNKDGIQPLMKSNFGNNDWYSYLCVVITFKFINFGSNCPVYD